MVEVSSFCFLFSKYSHPLKITQIVVIEKFISFFPYTIYYVKAVIKYWIKHYKKDTKETMTMNMLDKTNQLK